MRLISWPSWSASSGDCNSCSVDTLDPLKMQLNDQQKKLFQQFRERIEGRQVECSEPDCELVKWLVARNFDVEKAVTMYLKNLEWRKNWDIDDLLTWNPPEVLKKYYPVGMAGFDKEGCPVWIIPYGQCDMKGLLQSCTKRDYLRYTLRVMEKSIAEMRKQRDRLNTPIATHSVIFDLDNFALRHFTWKPAMDVVLELIQMNEANYPELLKCAYAINAPKLFTVAFAIIKPFLHEETQRKVKIFGRSGWKEELLKSISQDILPQHWGGCATDPDGDPKCPSKICLGGDIPKSYYLKKRKKNEEGFSDTCHHFKTLHLPKGSKETFEFQVYEAGSEIRWEFQTEDFDVSFEVSRILSSSGEEEILIPHQRINCQLVPEEGVLICTELATYKITFGNEFSYLRSKDLLYNLQLIPTSEMEHTKL